MISAPVQASVCQSLYGLSANWKMTTGRLEIGPFRLVLQNWLFSDGEQQRRGLAADAGDREQHAGHHAGARGAIADMADRRASAAGRCEVAASRSALGTSVSMSSVVRTTTGMTSTASATAPA